jgi:hypothetical protein
MNAFSSLPPALTSVALAFLMSPAWSQSTSAPDTAAPTFGPRIDALCPEVLREAVEFEARAKPTHVRAPPTRPALRENLLLMAKQDQEVREALPLSGPAIDFGSPQILHMRAVDDANLVRLKHIVNQEGFPTAEMVGLDGVKAAWLLTLHAGGDGDFQAKVLKLTTGHVRRGEVNSNDVAMLTDDLLNARGKPQRFGTNFEFRDGDLNPAPMEDEANVEARRRTAGLGTLANYACVLRAMNALP